MSTALTRIIGILEARLAETQRHRTLLPYANKLHRNYDAGYSAALVQALDLLKPLRAEMSDVFPDPEEPFNSLAEKELAEA